MTEASDEAFFIAHPERQAHIREPGRVLHKDKQRAVRYLSECELEFRSLGKHDKASRRLLLWKVPSNNPMYDSKNPQILKIPMLAEPGEVIEDTDEVLLPIIHEIMENAARG